MNARHTLSTFTLEAIPSLDVAVLGALQLITESELPLVPINRYQTPLVVGSGNAYATGRILFRSVPNAQFANESTATRYLNKNSSFDGLVVVSASGGKHAIELAQRGAACGMEVLLITNTTDAPASAYADETLVFPKNREPYTYNTSTYLSMIKGTESVDPAALHAHCVDVVSKQIPSGLSQHSAFTVIIPAEYAEVVSMVRTKFDELFGPMLVGRVFTEEEIKHAKTVVTSPTEFFIHIGEESVSYAKKENQCTISLPSDQKGYIAALAVSYFVIGHIQKQFPPYFAERIAAYTKKAPELFGYSVDPIVT